MEASASSLPHIELGHGSVRALRSLKEDVLPVHPVEVIQKTDHMHTKEAKTLLLRNTYGSAFVMRVNVEEQVLARHQRLPGLLSTKLGLESMFGALDHFCLEELLGDPWEAEAIPFVTLHNANGGALGNIKMLQVDRAF